MRLEGVSKGMDACDVTAIVLTKNEELNIGDCIDSLKGFASRIVVVDSGSCDGTVELAERLGADVFSHEFINYSRQFNWALDNVDIDTRWTLRFDADERLTPPLKEELAELMLKHHDDEVTGFVFQARLFFLGREIKHGGPQKRKIMLFRSGIGRIEDTEMDEHTILARGVAVAVKNRFIHYDFKDINLFIEKLNWYATREVKDYFAHFEKEEIEDLNDPMINAIRKKKFGFYYRFPKFLRCNLLFLYNYIFKLGFLDGKEGFVYHYMYYRWYRTLVDAKIFEQESKASSFADAENNAQ